MTWSNAVRVMHLSVSMSPILLWFLNSFALIFADYDNRRCLLYEGSCVLHCPRGMHPYHTRCDRDTMSQRTCDVPDPYVLGYTCGWSRCDCNGDTVLDETTGLCVENHECPEPKKIRKKPKGTRRRTGRRGKKKIRPSEDELPEME